MKLDTGHLTYCTNIHAGKNWVEDFKALQLNFPVIKQAIAPNQPLGLGLRLSNAASHTLAGKQDLTVFKQWLQENGAYVFTMNGFPYGDFHHTVVKADVHTPDWTTDDRREYTIRLFHILKALLPEGMEGGISTSPLSYRHWFKTDEALKEAVEKATLNMAEVIKELIRLEQETGLYMHLDVEPEPDGLLETGREFIDWFETRLLPLSIPLLKKAFDIDDHQAEKLIKRHLCLCYDVCHFAIGYEDHEAVLEELEQKTIKVGKIQISAALKASLNGTAVERENIKNAFSGFDEPTYLHQVVALTENGSLLRYPDLPDALEDFEHVEPVGNDTATQWRAHFHVPISVKEIGALQSTQDDIVKVLGLQKQKPFTSHMEVETYTWEVLPDELKLPIAQSISNELNWVLDTLK